MSYTLVAIAMTTRITFTKQLGRFVTEARFSKERRYLTSRLDLGVIAG
jgi:hypothetical protein